MADHEDFDVEAEIRKGLAELAEASDSDCSDGYHENAYASATGFKYASGIDSEDEDTDGVQVRLWNSTQLEIFCLKVGFLNFCNLWPDECIATLKYVLVCENETTKKFSWYSKGKWQGLTHEGLIQGLTQSPEAVYYLGRGTADSHPILVDVYCGETLGYI